MIFEILLLFCIFAILIVYLIASCFSFSRQKKIDELKLKNLEAEYKKIKNVKD